MDLNKLAEEINGIFFDEDANSTQGEMLNRIVGVLARVQADERERCARVAVRAGSPAVACLIRALNNAQGGVYKQESP